MINWGQTTAVRDRIGCAPQGSAAAASSQPSRPKQREQTWTARLGRSQVRTYTHRYARGTRLVSGDRIVEFLTNREPSLEQLTAVSWRFVEHHNAVTVRIRPSSRLRARAELRIVRFCESGKVDHRGVR
jgi:hypothetical protein